MTFFAGCVDFAPSDTQAREAGIVDRLSRHPDEKPVLFRSEDAFIAFADIGVLDQPRPYMTRGAASVFCGKPLFPEDSPAAGHAAEWFHGLEPEEKENQLSRACGQFCGATFDAARRELTLFVDRLAIRPIYYSIQDGVVYFSTFFRVLEQMPSLRRTMDLPGLAEQVAIGQPLQDRTAFQEIKSLMPGSVLRVTPAGHAVTRYWRWDLLRPADRMAPDAPSRCAAAFRAAVRRRLGGQEAARAFLSGGLDSRLIVTALKEQGVSLETYNFSAEGSADKVLSSEFAKLIGARHISGAWDWRSLLESNVYPFAMTVSAFLKDQGDKGGDDPGPGGRVFWSGDGGSVGLGHVYLTEEMAETFRNSGPRETVNKFDFFAGHMPIRCFKSDVRNMIDVRPNVIREIESYDSISHDRHIYLFALLNDQRRHLCTHFENIDLHRIEFELPFFDSDFLVEVFQIPLHAGLRHRLYHEVIEEFPEVFREVPWQSYPSHLPSPKPMPDGIMNQWKEMTQYISKKKSNYWRHRGMYFVAGKLPGFLRRDMLLLYYIALLFGANVHYVFEKLGIFVDAFRYANPQAPYPPRTGAVSELAPLGSGR